MEKVYQKAKTEIDGYRKELEEKDERRNVLFNMLDKQLPGWGEKYHELLGIGGRALTKEEREKVKHMLEWLKIHPDTDGEYEEVED